MWPAAAQYAGSAACAPCHASEYRVQPASPHAHALAPAPAGSPGEWAFGAGVKAVTYVSRTPQAGYVERGRSYYSRTGSFAPTPGHPDGADLPYPALAPGASVARCFRCHSTGTLTLGGSGAIQPAENGVGCEACHGPGAQHIASGGDPKAIGNPARLNAVELNQFCGTCHRRPPEPDETEDDRIAVGAKFDYSNRWNMRHQPAYLSQSACFRASGGALSCLTCHDAHSAASLPAADYDARCLQCHRQVKHSTAVQGACVTCHMPAVTATAEMQFADHWIGIYRGDAATTPQRLRQGFAPLVLPPTEEGKREPPNAPSTLRPLFEQVLADDRARFGKSSAQAAHSAWLLGAFLRETGALAAAEGPLREALTIERANGSPSAARDALELGQTLQSSGKRGEAIAQFEFAAERGDAADASRAHASLAKLDPPHAAAHYAKAVAAEEAASGRNSPKMAVLLSNLALALRAQGDVASAEPKLRRALELETRAFGPANLQTAVSENNLASVLMALGKLEEAESLQRQAIAVFERKLPNSSELAAAYANLAGLLAARNDDAGAEAQYRSAIAADEATGKSTLEEAADLASLGRLLRTRDPASAQTLLRQALSIYEARLGAASPQASGVRKELSELRSSAK